MFLGGVEGAGGVVGRVSRGFVLAEPFDPLLALEAALRLRLGEVGMGGNDNLFCENN